MISFGFVKGDVLKTEIKTSQKGGEYAIICIAGKGEEYVESISFHAGVVATCRELNYGDYVKLYGEIKPRMNKGFSNLQFVVDQVVIVKQAEKAEEKPAPSRASEPPDMPF